MPANRLDRTRLVVISLRRGKAAMPEQACRDSDMIGIFDCYRGRYTISEQVRVYWVPECRPRPSDQLLIGTAIPSGDPSCETHSAFPIGAVQRPRRRQRNGRWSLRYASIADVSSSGSGISMASFVFVSSPGVSIHHASPRQTNVRPSSRPARFLTRNGRALRTPIINPSR